MDPADYLEEVTRDLFDVARRAELGFDGQQIEGAVTILFFGENKSFVQFSGALDITFTYGRMLEAIMELREQEQLRKAEEAMESVMGQLEKTFGDEPEH